MTQIDDITKFEAEHAKREFAALEAEARKSLLYRIDRCHEALDEAKHRLLSGEMPNTCGILQTKATDIEMGIGALAALREAARHFKTLASAFDAASA